MQIPASTSRSVRLEIDYPESGSRLLALCGILYVIKALILLPVIIVMYIMEIAFMIVVIIGLFAVLFTGKYPRGLFDFNVRFLRWAMQVMVYFWSMSDKYPPFFPE